MSQQVLPAHPLEKRVLLAGIETPKSWTLDVYEKDQNGYAGARKALGMKDLDIVAAVKDSGLRGLGGAGFPAGMKWSFVARNTGKPTYLVCNADEGEPGTFKDRQIMEHVPHRLIDGMICAAHAIASEHGYIYIRGELTLAISRMEQAIEEAYAKGYLGKNIFGSGKNFDLTVHPGAGAYICGEETGLLSSLEGERGHPKLKPPFPAVEGYFRCPTVVNNVATLAHVPGILLNGGEWFKKLGGGGARDGGTNVLSVSGDVQRPGYYEVPININLKTLLNDICGGPLPGRQFKAVYPGGSSSPLLKAEEFDTPMDFDSLAKLKSMAGSGAIIVIDDRRSMPKMALRTARFYAHESCGQCVPCREGTHWVAQLLERICDGKGSHKDIDTVLSACSGMEGRTICVLTEACAWPIKSMINKFRAEFEALAVSEDIVEPSLPRVSGQMGALLQEIRQRQQGGPK